MGDSTTTYVEDPTVLLDTCSDASDSEELLSIAMAIVQKRPLRSQRPIPPSKNRAGRRTMYREAKSGSLSPDSSSTSADSQVSMELSLLDSIPRTNTLPNLTPAKNRFDLIANLPPELSMYIFTFFDDVRDLTSASRVSKTWNLFALERSLWAQVFKQHEYLGWKTMDSVELLWDQLKKFRQHIPQSTTASDSNSCNEKVALRSGSPYRSTRTLPTSSEQSTGAKVQEYEPRIEFRGNSPFLMNVSLERISGPVDYKILFWARHLLNRHWGLHRKDVKPITLDEAKALSLLHELSISRSSDNIQDEYRTHPSFPQLLHSSQEHEITRARRGKPSFKPDFGFLEGHTDSVYCVRLHSKPYIFHSSMKKELMRDGREAPLYDKKTSLGLGSRGRIYSGSRDRTVKIWDADTGLCLFTLKGHEGSVLCMDFDEEVLLTGSSDSNVFIWDLTKINQGKEPTVIRKLREHSAGVLDVRMNDRYILTCSKDATCRVYDRHDDYKTVNIYRGHGGPINAGGISSLDGVLHAVTASGDNSIQLWNLLTGELFRTFEGHTKGLACVSVVGSTVISGSSDHTVRIWDAKTGECLVRCDGHTHLVRAVAFDDVRKIVISAAYDGHVKLFDLRRHLLPTSSHIEGGNLVGEKVDLSTPGARHRIFDVQMDATRVVSCGESDKICVRDLTRGNPIMRLFV